MSQEELALLYKRFLSTEISERERELILTILQDCEENDLPTLEEVIMTHKDTVTLGADRSAEIFMEITGEHLSPSIRPFWKRKAVMGAAAALMITGLSFLFHLKNKEIAQVQTATAIAYVNETKFVKQIKLNDGSTVSLRQGAKLWVLSDFATDTVRRVQLLGEAFFEVSKQPEKAFVVVKSGGFDVRVLGTAFNLINTPHKNLLVLNHGKVLVNHGKQHAIVLPGQRAAFDKGKQTFHVVKTDTVQSNNWVNNLLSFEREPLQQIFKDLNNLHPEQRLRLNEKFEQEIFTGYLPANDLDKSLDILNKAFNTTIIYKHQ
ncbi:hypothetical protein KO02_16750 [Sphingobacterium sp. ML3W]|uniref:FecR family protein n=1 Tax=Sphingobacterium sp. ML3W TaxID=1538644 RepID=UPI0004F7E0C2|nr:FecR domain-containing protein [Sphingobacterium sp. ML3W]AIM38142.1 hypothetical protein KO02_16750 [Sphingobacterium sp. ML3W]